ncbi:hypothetical protein ACHWQZ_G005116 [Mnemiopsis leidyi]
MVVVSPTQNHNRYVTISYDLHADNSLKLCTKTNTLCVNIYLHAVLICSEKYPYYNDQVPIPTRQNTSAHQTTVKDGEESSNGDDTSQNQSNSKASNGTQRNVSSRKPLWNHRTGIKPRDGNDGDDDDPNPSTKPPKIKSRCERNDDPLDSCNGKSAKETSCDNSKEHRSRHISEGDIHELQSNAVGTQGTGLSYKRYKVEDSGTHSCDGHSFNIKGRSFLTESGISLDELQAEVKSTLHGISPEITPGQTKYSSSELFWRPNLISQLSKDLMTGKPRRDTNNTDTDDKKELKILLATINNQVNQGRDQKILFNGLRIIYTFDKSSRIPLKNNSRDNDLPLIIFHMGKPKDLSITPLRFNPSVETTEVCDVSLGNFCTVIIQPESAKHLHCYFSPEK